MIVRAVGAGEFVPDPPPVVVLAAPEIVVVEALMDPVMVVRS